MKWWETEWWKKISGLYKPGPESKRKDPPLNYDEIAKKIKNESNKEIGSEGKVHDKGN